MPAGDGDHLMAGLCSLWVEKIRKAKEHKKRAFQDDADEAMQFYRPDEGNYNFVYRGDLKGSKGVGLDAQEPAFRMTLNKVAELVEIFGPILYARNPVRQVNPRQPFLAQSLSGLDRDPGELLLRDPALTQVLMPPGLPPQVAQDPAFPGLFVQTLIEQEQQRASLDDMKSSLIESYLNFTPVELRLKEHVERAIDEAIIKGRGCVWTEKYTPPGSTQNFVGSFFDSVDFLQLDPDAENFGDAWWIARECCHPVWEVERKYGLEPGSLKGTIESSAKQAEVDTQKKQFDRTRGLTSDLMTYWQVYSRMGCGGRLSGSDQDRTSHDLLPGDLAGFAATLDPISGDHVYLAIAPGCDYPLNLPPKVQAMPLTGDGSPGDGLAEVRKRLAWPVPYWADGAWPVSVLDFHPVPRSPWPMSHIKPAMGELRFLCWAYSFVAGKIKSTLRDVVAILKEMAEEFKLQVLEGADLALVELDTQNRDIRECVQILQFPPKNADIWKVIEAVETNFEKRVGLNEIFYGKSQTQDRSATESSLKSQHLNIRPDDMSERVEAWATEFARKEAVAARMLLQAEPDVAPILGPVAGQLWASLVTVPPGDLTAFRELEYRIESGSTRKPNRERDMANADSSMQILLPVFNQFAAGTGQLGPLNALIAFWAKTRDINPAQFLLPAPPPAPMGLPPAGGGPASGGPPPPPSAPSPSPPSPPGVPS